MNRAEAAALLGVAPGAPAEVVRDAYRRRIRARHPDIAGASATVDAALINEAYDLLRHPAGPEPAARSAQPPASPRATAPKPVPQPEPPTGDVVMIDGETMGFAFPADEVFGLLVDVAHQVGDVTYVDAEANLLETVLNFEDGGRCSVLLSLQGRAQMVEAFCTVEPLDGSSPPPTSEVVSLLSSILADRVRSRGARPA